MRPTAGSVSLPPSNLGIGRPREPYSEEYFGSGIHEKTDELLNLVYLPVIRRWRKPTGTRALELGCATGRLSARLASLVPNLVAADIAPGALSTARERLGAGSHGVALARLDARRLPFPSSTFDLVIALDLVEHLDSPTEFLEEVARVLRPGGRAILSTPNYGSASRRFRPARWPGFADPTHRGFFTLAQLKAVALQSGLATLHAETPFTVFRRWRFLPRLLVRCIERSRLGGQLVQVLERPLATPNG